MCAICVHMCVRACKRARDCVLVCCVHVYFRVCLQTPGRACGRKIACLPFKRAGECASERGRMGTIACMPPFMLLPVRRAEEPCVRITPPTLPRRSRSAALLAAPHTSARHVNGAGSIRSGSRRARARRPGARVQVAERLGHGAILHKGAAYFGTADATVASMGRRAPSPSNALPFRPSLVPNCNCCVPSQRVVYSAKRSTATAQRAKAAKFFRMFLALHQPPTRERCLVIER